MKKIIFLIGLILGVQASAAEAIGSTSVRVEELTYSQVKALFEKGQPVSMTDFATADEIKNGAQAYREQFLIAHKDGRDQKRADVLHSCLVKATRNYYEYTDVHNVNQIVFQQEELFDRQNCYVDNFKLQDLHARLEFGKRYYKYDVFKKSLRASLYSDTNDDSTSTGYELGKIKQVIEYRKSKGILIVKFKEYTSEADAHKNYFGVYTK